MKTLVISDTHLTKNFEEKKFNFLKRIISEADQVIINGDFWEGYLISFEDFVNSRWKELFPLLKKKHTVYLYGNHDKKHFSDERISLFSDIQNFRYEFESSGRNFVFEHGNRLCPLMDEILGWERPFRFILLALNVAQTIMIRTYNRNLLRWTHHKFNEKIKNKIKKELKSHEIFFCGHTHLADCDEKNQFVNSGVVLCGLGQYVWIEDGKITPQEEWYDK